MPTWTKLKSKCEYLLICIGCARTKKCYNISALRGILFLKKIRTRAEGGGGGGGRTPIPDGVLGVEILDPVTFRVSGRKN